MILFKHPKDEKNFSFIHPKLQEIAKEMDSWLRSHFKIDLCITATISTLAEDQQIGRVSSSHREGRAFDVAIRTWTPSILRMFVSHFESKYSHLGAVSKTDNVRRFVVSKPHGTGPHLHIQLGKDIISNLEATKPKINGEESNGKSIRPKRSSSKAKVKGT